MLKSVTRHREFTGPTPHSVAIVRFFINFYNFDFVFGSQG